MSRVDRLQLQSDSIMSGHFQKSPCLWVWMCKLGVISQERLKIEVKLLLSANRKSYMSCRLAQQRMTLSDLEWRSTVGTRAFSVAGPRVCNSLPGHLWDLAVDPEQFTRDLKTYLFAGHLKS